MSTRWLSGPAGTSAARFLLRGQVQGIGVRPAIARLAAQLELSGRVANQTGGVEIHVEGTARGIEAFSEQLPAALPPAAVVERLVRSPAPITHAAGFRIDVGSPTGSLTTRLPRDLGVCDECLSDVQSPGNRRLGYPFTSCTNCGPRYSIIETMPWERCNSSMQEFDLCDACAEEFHRAADRRYHAQTNACPRCGPSLWSTDRAGEVALRGEAAMGAAVSSLRSGGIVAVKGIGGYQFVCDATCDAAVRRLRQAKQRYSKPLAVMLDDRFLNGVPASERRQFDSPANPIVLVSSSCATGIASNVSPGLDTVGVMRPTTPLHWTLLDELGRPLVVTSGNVDGEPLAYENRDAQRTLQPAADVVLHHDRRIRRPIDDSVVRVVADRPVTIRCARGIAPLPLALDAGCPPLLAVGGHQKVAVALCNGKQGILGPHVGDLDSVATRERFVEQTQQLMELYGVEPVAVAHDLHPDYFTTRWAQEQNVSTIAVQHHHAHVVCGMLEHDWLDRTVLGVAFDGTGFGPDGTVWGGEFLLATTRGFQRAGSLRPFLLAGGERAVREPWRVALSLLVDACGVEQAVSATRPIVGSGLLESALPLVLKRIGPETSSMGRLFDGIAALVLGVGETYYEGEAAMRLEAACDASAEGEYDLPLRETASCLRLDWRPLLRDVLNDRGRGVAVGTMAMKFHRAVAAAVNRVASRYADCPVVLSGGCFQNRILTELIADRLSGRAQPVGLPGIGRGTVSCRLGNLARQKTAKIDRSTSKTGKLYHDPGIIPPNDGGLAAGQLAVAQARLQDTRANHCGPARVAGATGAVQAGLEHSQANGRNAPCA